METNVNFYTYFVSLNVKFLDENFCITDIKCLNDLMFKLLTAQHICYIDTTELNRIWKKMFLINEQDNLKIHYYRSFVTLQKCSTIIVLLSGGFRFSRKFSLAKQWEGFI